MSLPTDKSQIKKKRKAPKSAWKKGQSGNPAGGPKLPEDVKAARQLNRFELERILNKYIHLSHEECEAAYKDPNTTKLERMIISLMDHGDAKGDQKRISFLLDRLGFVVVQKVEFSGGLNNQYRDMTDEQLAEAAAKLNKK